MSFSSVASTSPSDGNSSTEDDPLALRQLQEPVEEVGDQVHVARLAEEGLEHHVDLSNSEAPLCAAARSSASFALPCVLGAPGSLVQCTAGSRQPLALLRTSRSSLAGGAPRGGFSGPCASSPASASRSAGGTLCP